jgi:hypothetical protein
VAEEAPQNVFSIRWKKYKEKRIEQRSERDEERMFGKKHPTIYEKPEVHSSFLLSPFSPPSFLHSFPPSSSYLLPLFGILPSLPQYSIESNAVAKSMEADLKKGVATEGKKRKSRVGLELSLEAKIEHAKKLAEREKLLLSYDTGPQSLFFGILNSPSPSPSPSCSCSSLFSFLSLRLFLPLVFLFFFHLNYCPSSPWFSLLPLSFSFASQGDLQSIRKTHFSWLEGVNFVTLEKVLNPFLAERFMRKWYEFKKAYPPGRETTPEIVFVSLHSSCSVHFLFLSGLPFLTLTTYAVCSMELRFS